MIYSFNLIEIFPVNIIGIFFFFIFFAVLLLSYPIGRYFLINHCENSIIKYSLFSIIIFAVIVSIITNLAPRLDSTISLIYLGIFATGIAWLLRFYILKNNGLVFQAQVAYLIPIFGVILGYLFLNEVITSKVIISLIAVIIGIYIVKKGNKFKIV